MRIQFHLNQMEASIWFKSNILFDFNISYESNMRPDESADRPRSSRSGCAKFPDGLSSSQTCSFWGDFSQVDKLTFLESTSSRFKSVNLGIQIRQMRSDSRCMAAWKRESKFQWRETGPTNHHDDEVDLDQQVVNKKLSLPEGGGGSRCLGFGV